MNKRMKWEQFQDAGLLWWVNRILHLFGWSIIFKQDGGELIEVYPVRTSYRGFGEMVRCLNMMCREMFTAEKEFHVEEIESFEDTKELNITVACPRCKVNSSYPTRWRGQEVECTDTGCDFVFTLTVPKEEARKDNG